jgi:putative transcriptional regulator
MSKAPESRKRKLRPTSGKVLIASPFLNDFYFGRSVVVLADHNDDGSFGIILNKPLDLAFNEVVSEFPEFNAGVYLGGPVKSDSLYFIHTLGERISNAVQIMDGLYWGGDIDIVQDLIRSGGIAPGQIRFYLGYSGWGPKQLNGELQENSWVVSTEKATTLLRMRPDAMWSSMVKKLGDDYAEWIHYPIDPSLN